MAKVNTLLLALPQIEASTWQHYKNTGDFAVYAPKDQLADTASGMVHVDLAKWDIEQEQPVEGQPGLLQITLRAKGVDDQGRAA